MSQLFSLLQTAISFGVVILFGGLGEILTEKSGNLNLGVPGIMYMGGIASLAGAFLYESSAESPSPVLGLLVSLLCGLLAALLAGGIYSLLTITLRANQNVTGLTLTIFGSGIANFFGGIMNKMAGGVGQISVSATSSVYRATLPFLSQVEVFSGMGFMVYLGIAVAVIMGYIFTKTRRGLNLRAVGENPATADAAGINVIRYKYGATCLGAVISGLGGIYYVMDYTKGTWSSDLGMERLGWLAVALVIFARWKPVHAIWGAFLFGVLSRLYLYIPGLSRASQELFKMLPYLVTIAVLVVVSLRRSRENDPPASLGMAYFREER